MRIGLVAHPEKPHALALARASLTRLAGRAEVVLTPETRAALGVEMPAEPLETLSAEALVAFGGDGTFLMTLQRSAVPLLPINTGTVGFLAEVDGGHPSELDRALERLLAGDYHLEERMKLGCEVDGRTLPDAVNEVVVHTRQVAKMRLFEVSIDHVPVGRVRADGMIVATPTGSTSYSLSALGPIVDPAVDSLVVTSLAPFQTIPRAVVVDPLKSVGIRLVLGGKDAVVVADGHAEVPVPAGGEVLCYRSPRKAVFIRFTGRFFERLEGKRILPWLERPGEGSEPDEPDLPPHA